MNAKEHTRANKWAAHVKESSMNKRDEVRTQRLIRKLWIT